ncbi:MAG: hypothetical protein KDI83_19120 [Gammaproteobacteria bacterium]|nr:hypothetical protein [Gammaproteobacteria bacterium]
MSNTSTVSPYENTNRTAAGSHAGTGAGVAAVACAGAVTGAAALALAGTAAGVYGVYRLGRWLAKAPELTAEQLAEIQAVEQEYREKMGQEEAPDTPELKTLNLHLEDSQTLVSAASGLGYRVVEAPDVLRHEAASPVLLERSDGERIAITRNEQGRLDIHTAADQALLNAVMSRHTEERVLSHLTDKGMQFKTARLANGEMQILSHEPNAGQVGGAAQIKAQVRSDGTAWVDVDRCRGRRCEDIVQQIAGAVGGTVTTTDKKDAWYQLPGEPTKTRVKT